MLQSISTRITRQWDSSWSLKGMVMSKAPGTGVMNVLLVVVMRYS